MLKRKVFIYDPNIHKINVSDDFFNGKNYPEECNWRLNPNVMKTMHEEYMNDPDTNTPQQLGLKYGVSEKEVIKALIYAKEDMEFEKNKNELPEELRNELDETMTLMESIEKEYWYSNPKNPNGPPLKKINEFYGHHDYHSPQPIILKIGQHEPIFVIYDDKKMEKLNNELMELQEEPVNLKKYNELKQFMFESTEDKKIIENPKQRKHRVVFMDSSLKSKEEKLNSIKTFNPETMKVSLGNETERKFCSTKYFSSEKSNLLF